MAEEKIPVVAVVGPTASGKSGLGVELAQWRNGEVISADSMQIYREMQIATAKPTQQEMRGIPHHLVDFAPLAASFSVADYVALAKACIAEVTSRGKLPIIVGGTGLYIRSLLGNIRFSQTDPDETLRRELYARAEREGSQALWQELNAFDPESARRIHRNNLSRVIRAIEVYRTTGMTMTQQIEKSKLAPSPYRTCMIGLDYRDREKLYRRIDHRVDLMLEAGLLEEACWVLAQDEAATAMQAIGYKELRPYFDGAVSLEEAVLNIKRETRRYAKRQLTWFRREENIRWLYMDDYESPSVALQAAKAFITEELGPCP